MTHPKPGPYLIRKQPPTNMPIAGTSSWGEVWEIVSAPHGIEAVDAQFVAFCPDQADAELLATVYPLREMLLTLTSTMTTLLQAANPSTPMTETERLHAISQGLTAISHAHRLVQQTADPLTQHCAAYLATPNNHTRTALQTTLLSPQERAGPELLGALKELLAFHQARVRQYEIPSNLACEARAETAISKADLPTSHA